MYNEYISFILKLIMSSFQGDQIEMMLSKKFPISTMTAAALGNTISDIIGIGSVDYVERFAQSVGFKAPKLTPMQLNLRKTKAAANMVYLFYFLMIYIK